MPPSRKKRAREIRAQSQAWRQELRAVREHVPSWDKIDHALESVTRYADYITGTAAARYAQLHAETDSPNDEPLLDLSADEIERAYRHLTLRVDAARLAVHLRQAHVAADRVFEMEHENLADLPESAFPNFALDNFRDHVARLDHDARRALKSIIRSDDDGFRFGESELDSSLATQAIADGVQALAQITRMVDELSGKRQSFDRAHRNLSDLGYFRGFATAAAQIARHPIVPKTLSVQIEELVDRIQDFDVTSFADPMTAASELLRVEEKLNALIAQALPGTQGEATTTTPRSPALLDRDFGTEAAAAPPRQRRRSRI